MKSRIPIRNRLQGQLKENRLCDVTFLVGNSRIYAHRCVLAGVTDYFDVMFSSEFRDKDQDEIDMSGVFTSIVPLRFIIDYIYGTEVTLPEDYTLEILNASKLFMLNNLTEECNEYLCNTLTLRMCFGYWSIADRYDLKYLYAVCTQVISCRFHDTLKDTEEALCLSPEHLARLFRLGISRYCTINEWSRFLELWSARGNTEKHRNIQKQLTGKIMEEDEGTKGLPRNFSDLVTLQDVADVIVQDTNDRATDEKETRSPSMKDTSNKRDRGASFPILESSSETTAKPMSSIQDNSSSGLTTEKFEEVIVCKCHEEFMVYRPKHKKWLVVSKPGPENFGEDQILLGVGNLKTCIFRRHEFGGKLFDLKEIQETEVVRPRSMGEHQYFSVLGSLFCVGYLGSHVEQGVYYIQSHANRRLVVLVYVFCKNEWQCICDSGDFITEFEAFPTRPFVLQSNLDDVIILSSVQSATLASSNIAMYMFNPKRHSLRKQSILPHSSGKLTSQIICSGYALSDGFIFNYYDKELVYTFSSDDWCIREQTDPGAGTNWHLTRECYMNTFGAEIFTCVGDQNAESFYRCIFAYLKKNNEFFAFPPMPGNTPCKISCQLVSSDFLDRLPEKICDLDIDTPLSNSFQVYKHPTDTGLSPEDYMDYLLDDGLIS